MTCATTRKKAIAGAPKTLTAGVPSPTSGNTAVHKPGAPMVFVLELKMARSRYVGIQKKVGARARAGRRAWPEQVVRGLGRCWSRYEVGVVVAEAWRRWTWSSPEQGGDNCRTASLPWMRAPGEVLVVSYGEKGEAGEEWEDGKEKGKVMEMWKRHTNMVVDWR